MPALSLPDVAAENRNEAVTSMDMLACMLSAVHDMKNSLCVMTAHLEAALAELPIGTPSRHMAFQALYEAQRVNGRLVQLLGLYKISGNIYPFDPDEVELASFTREVIARIEPLAQARGISIDVVTEAGARHWYFDADLVAGVVIQALHNALAYARERVHLALRVDDDQLEIRIDDDGPGFPPEQLVATPESACRSRAGTGLGLYFAARAAHLHRNRTRRGRTQVANDGILGGAAFILKLP